MSTPTQELLSATAHTETHTHTHTLPTVFKLATWISALSLYLKKSAHWGLFLALRVEKYQICYMFICRPYEAETSLKIEHWQWESYLLSKQSEILLWRQLKGKPQWNVILMNVGPVREDGGQVTQMGKSPLGTIKEKALLPSVIIPKAIQVFFFFFHLSASNVIKVWWAAQLAS